MRYLPLTSSDRSAMLAAIGVDSVDDLFAAAPNEARHSAPFDLPQGQGELAVERHLGALAKRNVSAGQAPFFLGAGAYRHHVPAAVDHLIQRGEFLTSYTPYQPEIAQGTLQALFEFQSQVALLTGMDIANASMYDGSTACAEAVTMAARITKRSKALLSGGLHPHYRQVVETYARYARLTVEAGKADAMGNETLCERIDSDTACVVVQNPSLFGHIRDLTPLAEAAHAKGALLVVVVTEIMSLGALVSPGTMGADIVAAEGQSLGNALNFGGPYLGLFAVRERLMRQMPGRLAGQTVDAAGKRGWTLTLSTREQHIRREKATSNICTNSGLCALAFTIHLSLLGESGLRHLATLNHAQASLLADRLAQLPGVTLITERFFNEFTLRLPCPAAEAVEKLAAKNILAGVPVSRLWGDDPALANLLLVAVTETNSDEDMAALIAGLAEVL